MSQIDNLPLGDLMAAFHQAGVAEGAEVIDDRELARQQNRGNWIKHRPESVTLGVMEPQEPADVTPADVTPVPMPEGAQDVNGATYVSFPGQTS